jgi:histone-binding protein RBBP4
MRMLLLILLNIQLETKAKHNIFKCNVIDVGGIGLASPDNRIDIETKILHDGEVNRARFMPQKYNVIASHTTSGEIHIFDYSQHPTTPVSLEQVRPEVRLIGHQAEGYGLSWSKHKVGHLLSAANDQRVSFLKYFFSLLGLTVEH